MATERCSDVSNKMRCIRIQVKFSRIHNKASHCTLTGMQDENHGNVAALYLIYLLRRWEYNMPLVHVILLVRYLLYRSR
jgi:hypothetical protein